MGNITDLIKDVSSKNQTIETFAAKVIEINKEITSKKKINIEEILEYKIHTKCRKKRGRGDDTWTVAQLLDLTYLRERCVQ